MVERLTLFRPLWPAHMIIMPLYIVIVEILVEPYIDVDTGTQGYDITFDAVPDSYTDPLKGTNDHAGYRIYKSEQIY